MDVLVHLPLMSEMVVVVRTVLAGMGMSVHRPLAFVRVSMLVLVSMFVRVEMRMLVSMRYIGVRMFMAVHMCMLVAVKMGMFVLSFHRCRLRGWLLAIVSHNIVRSRPKSRSPCRG
ncbi:MAG: hypothetical protein ABSB94_07330 [Syntrophorhabdales bacterium]|jgi:hypothetical protein